MPPCTGDTPQPWRRAAAALRAHWLIAVLGAAGVTLRALTLAAYHPALIYVDTLKYLYGVYPGSEPLGYAAALRLALLAGGLGTAALLQHLLGLAMATALYAVLLRRGAARWLAAVATAPVLLDAYQLQLEQMIMPDVLFEAMIVAGLAVLLWRPTVTAGFAVTAGLILGAAASVKALGEVLALPAVLYLLLAGGGWRRSLAGGAALALAFAVPVLGYCGVSYARTGHFWLARPQGNTGRLAASADCATLRLPAAARPLCPGPAAQAMGPDWLEHSGHSPLYRAAIPPGATRGRLIAALGSAVERQQPVRVAAAVARDSLRLFALTRAPSRPVTPISRWQFQAGYPVYPPWVSLGPGNVIVVGLQHRAFGRFSFRPLRPSYGGAAQTDLPVASFLRAYQLGGGYTPGPLLAVFTLAGAAGSLLALRRRGGPGRRQLALGSLLFTATAAAALLVPDILEFSWRYQLPALITLPPAGVLGAAALLPHRQAGRRAFPRGPFPRRSVPRAGQPVQADLGQHFLGGPGPGPQPGGGTGGQ